MEDYSFKWQMFVGAGILLLLSLSIFLPRMKISGTSYVDMAVSVNEKAKKYDSKKAEDADAQSVIDDYGADGEERDSQIDHYDEKIKDKTGNHGTISGLFFGKWALTVDDTLSFDGIHFKEGKKIEDSGVQNILKLMGVCIYLPILLALALILFIFIKRQTYAKYMILVGGVSVVCECVSLWVVPSLIWPCIKDYVQSFAMISKDVLKIDGVGAAAIRSMLQKFGTSTGILVIVASLVLIALGILFLTVCKPKEESDEDDFDFIFQSNPVVTGGNTVTPGSAPWQPDLYAQVNKASGSVAMGKITGVTGQYAGQSIELKMGEEIVLGRDPKYCMLVFDYPKVSRKHCGIRFDANSGMYQVIDYSSNGTKLSTGGILSTSTYTPVSAGTIVLLGNGKESVRLG